MVFRIAGAHDILLVWVMTEARAGLHLALPVDILKQRGLPQLGIVFDHLRTYP